MSKPFDGFNFCCTALRSSHRQELELQINALGGTLYVDLMSLVNVLIVGGRKTEKYKYSVRYRHDVLFVSPDAISDIYSRWVKGDDQHLDITESVLPVFHNMTICVARVEPPLTENYKKLFGERFRHPPAQAVPSVMPKNTFLAENLIETMLKLGADVSATLTPDCTVLVGTDTDGKRYRMAREWKIPVVHPIWVFDSCLRGAALHLEDYELTPGTFNLYSSTSFAWKSLFLLRIRPLRTPSMVEKRDRPVLKKSLDVWTSIMSSTHQPTVKQVRDSSWGDSNAEAEEAEQEKDEEAGAGAGSISSKYAMGSAYKYKPHGPGTRVDSLLPPASKPSTLFLGLTFLPVGLSVPEQNLLKKVVESHLGRVAASSDEETITHIVLLVRDGPQAHLMLLMLPGPMKQRINRKNVSVVTDWFIERSVYYNELRQDTWCRPMEGIVPLLLRYKVSISGFTGVEFLHIEKLIGLLNLEFCEVFNSKRDLLIVNVNLFKKPLLNNSPKLFEYKHEEIVDCPIYKNGEDSRSVSTMSSKNKINAARKWNIPVVSVAYLWEMVEILGGQPNLQFPDIYDLSWCLFAPKAPTRPSSLMEYVRAANEAPGKGSVGHDEDLQDRVQLPSPRKTKDKQRYGRLVGGGESLTEKLLKSKEEAIADNDDRSGGPDISINDDENLTQVGYGSADSSKEDNQLWKDLETINGRLPKRRRTRG